MNELKENERLVRLRGRVATDKIISLGDEVVLKVKGECIKVEEENNHDGTKDIISIIQLTEI